MTRARPLAVLVALGALSCATSQHAGSDPVGNPGPGTGTKEESATKSDTKDYERAPDSVGESDYYADSPSDESGPAGEDDYAGGGYEDYDGMAETEAAEPVPEPTAPSVAYGGEGGRRSRPKTAPPPSKPRPRRDYPRREKKAKGGVGSFGTRGGAAGSGAIADRGVRRPSEARTVDKEPAAPPRPIEAPSLKAGRHDDNNQYNRFLSFLGENSFHVVYPVNVDERLVIHARDKQGKSLHDCTVRVKNLDGKVLSTTTTYADGSTHFFPLDKARPDDQSFAVSATCRGKTRNGQLSRGGKRATELRFNFDRSVPKQVPVDIAIVLDTTGSMQSQIDRLKNTLKAIHFQLTQLSTRPDVRFGLVAYRDRDDDYVTRVSPFTDDVKAFQHVLNKLDADGGGDTPEDLQAALDDAMHKLDWRTNALRLGFIVSDAIPHTDYGQKYDYREAMRDSLERGIKWTTVGAGGLGRDGEVIFRQIAQYTMGEYVFITEGGVGDSEGSAVEASHHVGSNYKTENLDQAILRIVRRELSYLTDVPMDFDYTIVAQGTKATPRGKVLAPAVAELVRQLHDYSSMRLGERTPVAIVPVAPSNKEYKDVAGYLTDQIVLSASRYKSFRLVERDLQEVSDEVKFQLSDLVDVEQAVPVGKMLGAELIIVAKLTVKGDVADLYAKLIRVETAEILSVGKVDLVGGVIHSS